MKSLYSSKTTIAIIPLFIISIIIKNMSTRPVVQISKEEASFTLNKDILYYLSLGNRRLISSYLWSYTLLESDIEHYKKNDGNSWMFKRFNTIARLDPKFYENYLYGGQYLSIVKDDVFGAESIYNKGLHHYPDDFYLNFNHGFNYYFEIGELKKAYRYFRKIQFHPKAKKAAPYLASLVSKMAVEQESLETAYTLLQTALESNTNKNLIKRYKKQLYAIKAEIDTKCLNTQGPDCSEYDYNNNLYILKDGRYQATQDWKKFRLSKKRKRKQRGKN